jgi:methylated-DNA-protein-cysteine methyltransferase-like protein
VTEKQAFHDRAVRSIKGIPAGKVATYGLIARLAGSPRAARQVAYVLNSSWKKHNLPWHRVVNSKGGISLKPGRGYEEQKALLEKEGVVFREDGSIDLALYQWKPERSLADIEDL